MLRADQISSNKLTQVPQLLRVSAILQISMGFSAHMIFQDKRDNLVGEIAEIMQYWQDVVTLKLKSSIAIIRQIGIQIGQNIAENEKTY